MGWLYWWASWVLIPVVAYLQLGGVGYLVLSGFFLGFVIKDISYMIEIRTDKTLDK